MTEERQLDDGSSSILEAMPEAVVVADARGVIVFANHRAEALCGYARSELLGRPLQLVVPGWPAGLTAIAPLTGGGERFEAQVRRRDGTGFLGSLAAKQVRIHRRPHLLVSLLDLTHGRRLEEELQETREGFRMLAGGATDHAIYLLDPEGRVVSWNEGVERIKGYPASEILGRSYSTFFLPDDVLNGKPQRSLELALSQGRFEDEGWRRRRDDSRFWASTVLTPTYDDAGRLRGFATILRDKTESRQAAERLQAFGEIAEAIVQGGELDQILTMIARKAQMIAGTAVVTALTPDRAPGTLTVRIALGPGANRLRGRSVSIATSLSGHVFSTGTPVIVDDIWKDPRVNRSSARTMFADTGPTMMVPLSVRGRAFGVLTLANPRRGRRLTQQDLSLLHLFAVQAGMALEYGRIREELQRMAVLADRERIGRELHDGSIQSLFAVTMNLELVVKRVSDPQLQLSLETAIDQLRKVLADLRNYVFGLRPEPAAEPTPEPEPE